MFSIFSMNNLQFMRAVAEAKEKHAKLPNESLYLYVLKFIIFLGQRYFEQ